MLAQQVTIFQFSASNYMFMEFVETLLSYVMLSGGLAESFAEGAVGCRRVRLLLKTGVCMSRDVRVTSFEQARELVNAVCRSRLRSPQRLSTHIKAT